MRHLSRILSAVRSGTALAGLLAGACGDDRLAHEQQLPRLPASYELVCSGPIYPDTSGGGYTGQCCEHVVCRQPVDNACPEKNDGRFYGSGLCLCSGEGPKGPFAIAVDHEK